MGRSRKIRSEDHDHDLGQNHSSAHDESNWLVSYADMMTLLFGFFVLMYSMSRVDSEKFSAVSKDVAKFFGGKIEEDVGIKIATEDVKKYISQLTEQLRKQEPSMASIPNPNSTEASNEVDDAPVERQVEVENHQNSVTLKFRGSILFAPGSSQLKSEAEKVINDLAQKLKATGRVESIRVEGHTDDIPIRSRLFPTNWELSASRAARVVRQLTANGFLDRQLVAEGFSSSQPDAVPSSPDGKMTSVQRGLNRRVVLKVRFIPARTADEKSVQNEYFEHIRHADGKPQAKVADTGAIGDAQTLGETEKRIAEAEGRLQAAQERLRAKEEQDRKLKKLEELERKLSNLNKKAEQVEERLRQKPEASERAPARQGQ